MDALISRHKLEQPLVISAARWQPETGPEQVDALAGGAALERRARRNVDLWQPTPRRLILL